VIDKLEEAQRLMLRLLKDHNLTHDEIAQRLENRASARTLRRWSRGEHAPQRVADFLALEALVKSLDAPAESE
jgi:transcriptional regulator with XRE-family HTH domain